VSDEEKVDFKRKMAEIDVAGANDMQSATQRQAFWFLKTCRNWYKLLLFRDQKARYTCRGSAGRNTFGTCFGEMGLKIRPDVFCHDNGEQKKHVLLCKMSPASHFFLFEKGEKNNK